MSNEKKKNNLVQFLAFFKFYCNFERNFFNNPPPQQISRIWLFKKAKLATLGSRSNMNSGTCGNNVVMDNSRRRSCNVFFFLQPARLQGELCVYISEGQPLPVHGADGAGPLIRGVPGQLRNITGNLKKHKKTNGG